MGMREREIKRLQNRVIGGNIRLVFMKIQGVEEDNEDYKKVAKRIVKHLKEIEYIKSQIKNG